MSKTRHITPEAVAHNIASCLSNKFISDSENINFCSLDDTQIVAIAKKSANIYGIAYDEAYETIRHYNDDLAKYPE